MPTLRDALTAETPAGRDAWHVLRAMLDAERTPTAAEWATFAALTERARIEAEPIEDGGSR